MYLRGLQSLDAREVAFMIDNAVLRRKLQAELDVLGFAGAQAEQVTRDVNVLACLLIDAVLKGGQHDKAN